MVYRADLVIDYRAFQSLTTFVQQYPDTVAKEVRARFYGEIGVPMLEDFQYYPGAAKNSLNSGQRFVWSENHEANLRAQRWFFAHFPEGYTRTGKLAKGYTVGVSESDDALSIYVRNPMKALRYVKGKRQIPGHRNTGWRKDDEIFAFWRDRVREMTVKVVKRIVPNW